MVWFGIPRSRDRVANNRRCGHSDWRRPLSFERAAASPFFAHALTCLTNAWRSDILASASFAASHCRPGSMSDDLKFQLRLTLNEGFAQAARSDPGNPSLAPLTDILKRHDAAIKCQFDAFADYVSDAEANGAEKYPLYEWKKQTIE